MPANVLPFLPQEGQTNFPTPMFYSPGDEYTRVNIVDDSCARLGLYPGAVVIFLQGFRQDGALHLLGPEGSERITRLWRHGRYVRVGVRADRTRRLPAPELDVYGAMAELYPAGLSGPRSVVYREDRARLMLPLHPETGMEYRLVAAN